MANTVFQSAQVKVKVKGDGSLQATTPITLKNAVGSGGGSINDLFDVNVTSVANSDILAYQANSGQWVNRLPTAITGTSQQILVANNTAFNYQISLPNEVIANNINVVNNFVVGTGFSVDANGVLQAANINVQNANVALLGVNGNAVVNGNLTVINGFINISSTATFGNTDIIGYVNVTSTSNVGGIATFRSNVVANGVLIVSNTASLGNTTVTGFANVIGNVQVSDTIAGNNLTLSGNLTVSGTTTYINTTQLNVGDNIVVLNADVPNNVAPSENAGLEVNRGNAANAYFYWDESNDQWSTVGANLAIGNTTIAGFANVSTSLQIGANVLANTSRIAVGNSTVNTYISKDGLYTYANGTHDASLYYGGVTVRDLIDLKTTSLQTGFLRLQDSLGSFRYDTVHLSLANLEFYITANGDISNTSDFTTKLYANTTYFGVGNTTANAVVNYTAITVANSTSNVVVTPTSVSVGSNVSVNTSALFIGNSSVNAVINSSAITVSSLNIGTASLGNTTVTGFINVSSTANVGGAITARGDVTVNGTLTVANTAALGNTTVTGFINVSSSANVGGTLNVNGAVTVTNTAALGNTTITGFVNVSSTANVGGVATFRANVVANGQLIVANTASVGNTTVTGFINVSSTANIGDVLTARANVIANGQLIVSNTASLGNTTVTGFVNVSSSANVGGTLNVNGAVTVTNTIAVGNTTVTGFINVSSTANIGDVLTARANVVANGQLIVSNAASLGNTTVTGFINVSSTANIGGDITARANVTVNGALTVANTAALGDTTITGFINVSSTANIGGNLSVGTITTYGTNANLVLDPNGTGIVVISNASGGAIGIEMGSPTLGNLVSNAVSMTTNTSVSDGIAQLNKVLGKLVPPSPTAFPNGSISVLSTTSYRMTSFTQTDNTPSSRNVAGGTTVTSLRTSSFTTSNVVNSGPGDTGTVSAYFNNVASGSVTLTTTLTPNTVNGQLRLYNNLDYNTVNNQIAAGFWSVFSANGSGTASAGWNEFKIGHSAAGNTNVVAWYYDNSAPGTPTFSGTGIAVGTSSLTYSSTVPHYNNGTSFNLTFYVNRLSGDLYPTTDNFATGISGGAFGTPATVTYAAAGVTTPLARNLFVASGNTGLITTTASIISGFGSSAAGPQIQVNNSYATGSQSFTPSGTVLYKTGLTNNITTIEEANVYFGSTVGTGAGAASRIINPGSTDTPSYTASASLFNSQTGTLQTYDATVVAGSLKHDQTNYSTGYLPAGPNLSVGRTGSQYFTFKFVRTSLSKFDIRYSGTLAGLWVALPGSTIDTTSTLNGWLDCSIAYNNSGTPGAGAGGNGTNGCGLSNLAVLNSAQTNKNVTVTFGPVSSSSTATNEIYVRIKLTSGQTVTALSLQTASA